MITAIEHEVMHRFSAELRSFAARGSYKKCTLNSSLCMMNVKMKLYLLKRQEIQ